MPEAPVPPAYGFEIGEILARIHALDVEWTRRPVEDPASRVRSLPDMDCRLPELEALLP